MISIPDEPLFNVVYMKRITRADARKNPNAVFVFGDNDARSGYGGLAKELRGEPNAIGIRVKKKPSTDDDAYYTDEEYTENINKITEDINKLIDKVNENMDTMIVFPADGIGTGMARMKYRCPDTFEAMNLILDGTLLIRNGG